MGSCGFLSHLLQRVPRHRNGRPRPSESESESGQDESEEFTRTTIGGVEFFNSAPYMSRAIYESPGINESTCEVNGDPKNPDRLPILAKDYLDLNVSVQHKSPFFTKLPPEIRQIIYLYAFGDRRIHFDYDFSTDRGGWTWWHRICDDPLRCPGKEFACPETEAAETSMLRLGSRNWTRSGFEYKLDALGWVASCKTAYQETLPALYTCNTFIFSQGIDQLSRLTKVLPQDHLSLLTCLSLEIDVYRICRRPPPEMDTDFAQFYNTTFNLINKHLPTLRELTFSIAGIPHPNIGIDEWTPEDEKAWIGPWEGLARGRVWKCLEIAVAAGVFGVFEGLVKRRAQLKGEEGYGLVKRIEPYQNGWG
ncbi:hypothetical protein BDV12DRAFT_206850 [Aspergillus spectabilis]